MLERQSAEAVERRRQHQEVVQRSPESLCSFPKHADSNCCCCCFYKFHFLCVFAGVEQVRGATAGNTARDEPDRGSCVCDWLPCVAPAPAYQRAPFRNARIKPLLRPPGAAETGGAGGGVRAEQRQPSQRKSKSTLVLQWRWGAHSKTKRFAAIFPTLGENQQTFFVFGKHLVPVWLGPAQADGETVV